MTVDFRQLNARTWEVVRVTTAGEQQLGCLECPYFGGDQGKLTVFKYLFQSATLKYPLFEHELRKITAFGNERERQARAAYLSELSEGAAQKPTAETNPTVYGFAKAGAEPTDTKTKGDAAADKIIAAFEGEECLTDGDLLKASGLSRNGYFEVRDYLLYGTCELNEMEEDDGSTVYEYAKPRKQLTVCRCRKLASGIRNKRRFSGYDSNGRLGFTEGGRGIKTS